MNVLMDKAVLSQKLLKYATSLVLLLIGLDQVFRTDLLHAWNSYVNPLAASIVPANIIILVLGIAEIVVAVMMATKFTKLAAYISAIVLVVTAINLLMLGFVDVAARDVLLIGSMLVLAWLTTGIEAARGATP